MSTSFNDIEEKFGGKLRIRVSGICLKNDALLMVNHKGLGDNDIFWAPPGGGMIFGSSAEENLIREFKEETGLKIKVNKFLFVHEYIGNPLHAVELFFSVEIVGGTLSKGNDPEMVIDKQIIDDVKFMEWHHLKNLRYGQVHQIISHCSSILEIFNLKGYFKFENNYIK
ncbi:MAG: NUDIX domain-containing protein [Bacteroidota bacterium]|nr:NUDIX domain-containing protein [Bacteroidota bacterium]